MKLDPWQETAEQFLLTHPLAAYFGGLGLGKTAVVINAFEKLFRADKVRSMLVVAPRRVSILTWPHETRDWGLTAGVAAPLRRREVRDSIRGPIGPVGIYTINYESLPKMCRFFKAWKIKFDIIVFDELTKLQSHKSKAGRAIRDHCVRLPPSRRWGLTGSPTPNSMLQLFGQFKALDDGKRLGRSYVQFKGCYFTPTDYMEYNWVPLPGTKQRLLERIKDITLIQRTSDYVKLPPLSVVDSEVSLPKVAYEQYNTFKAELILQIETNTLVAASAGVLVNKLLQITGGAVYNEGREVIDIHDTKIRKLHSILKVAEGTTIICCSFRHEKARILRACPGAKALDSFDDDDDMLHQWNAGKVKHLVIDPRQISHGLNMQLGGSRIVWFSLPWSRELYDQTNGRLYRRGQTEEVEVIRILCPGTIDDAIAATLDKRGKEQTSLMETLKNLQELEEI